MNKSQFFLWTFVNYALLLPIKNGTLYLFTHNCILITVTIIWTLVMSI